MAGNVVRDIRCVHVELIQLFPILIKFNTGEVHEKLSNHFNFHSEWTIWKELNTFVLSVSTNKITYIYKLC